jgi:hypothetical protein
MPPLLPCCMRITSTKKMLTVTWRTVSSVDM